MALTDHGIGDAAERDTLHGTIAEMQRLHAEGSDHIWAYYSRNLVRPVALSRQKVDVVIGNPPWLNYNKTASTLRTALEQRSKHDYDIWTGGRYATHQDVAGLFFTRSADLYLRGGGVIGMVLPHSALQTGQYAKWRSGAWHAAGSGSALTVDFGYKAAWDLEKLEPNTFFPIAAAVVFARRTGGESRVGEVGPLTGQVERWLGRRGRPRCAGSTSPSPIPRRVANHPTPALPGKALSSCRAVCSSSTKPKTRPSSRPVRRSP